MNLSDLKIIVDQIKREFPDGSEMVDLRVSHLFPFMMRQEAKFNNNSTKFADPSAAERTMCHGWYDKTWKILTVSPDLFLALQEFMAKSFKLDNHVTTKRNIQRR